MPTDNDIKKDFNSAYDAGQAHWSTFWEEAKYDIQFRNGKPDAKDEAYLKAQDREVLNFNKCRRIVNVVTGYEQKNLLALKIDPIEGSDDKTASQFTGLVMHNMLLGGGYAAMSGAFEFGTVVSGMNLLEPWVDRSSDLLNGDIRFRRLPYNRFILDPTFQDRDLDIDCNYLITRDYFNKDVCAALLPNMEKEIKQLKGGFTDSKFGHFYPQKGRNNEYNLKWDRFYTSTYRPYKILADTKTGKIVPINNNDPRSDEIIQLFIQRYPQLKLIKGAKKGVDLHIFSEGELMYSGPDPSGLDEYPFVLEAGYWTPEDDDPKYRIMGMVRDMRDPGREVNRRRSQIIDMLDAVIRMGWKYKDGTVINEEELYSSGFAVVKMEGKADMMDAQQLAAPQIPQGLFQAVELLDKDHDSIAGVNSEMLGSPEDKDVEVAAILSKMRSANGLTTLQGLFAGHRFAKVLLGRKQVKMIQKNFTPSKVARLLGEAPTQQFYTQDFGKYDCNPTEAPLTDSQRQAHYAHLWAMKKSGAPITWEQLIEYGPMPYKDKFKEEVKRAEAAQSKQAMEDQKLQAVTTALLNAQKFQAIATGQEKLTQAQENKTTSQLDRARTIKELNDIDLDSFAKTIGLLQTMLTMLQGEQTPQQTQLPTLANIPTAGSA
jgi:uncharacterized protein YciI